MRRLPIVAALLAVPMLAALVPAPVRAETHALLVGIDDYVFKRPKLGGAVNDALGINDALKGRGVADVVLLTNRKATRADFEHEWAAMTERARSGDTIFLSFAGHGMRTPETGATHHAADGFDKGFVLAPYDEEKAPDELLRDEHLYDLFKAASDKGLHVVFVADACHSGAGIRGIGPNRGRPTRQTSFLPRYDTTVAADTTTTVAADPPKERPPIANVNIFSATEPEFTIREVELGGRAHGALSYELALGLTGAADDTKQGTITAGELRRYVAPLIRSVTENSQVPRFLVPNDDLVLVADPKTADAPPPVLQLGGVKVNAAGGDAPQVGGATMVDSPAEAALLWDIRRQEVRNRANDVLATGIDGAAMQGVVDARRLLDALNEAMQARGAPLATRLRPLDASGQPLAPSDRAFASGMKARFEADATDFRFVTVFDVNANGTIQFDYPLTAAPNNDPLEWTESGPLHFDGPVTAPFGGDFIVFLATPKPLPALHQELARLNNKVAAADLVPTLRQVLVDTPYHLGILSVFTCEHFGSNGQCEH